MTSAKAASEIELGTNALMLGSVNPLERERARLLLDKAKADEDVRRLKQQVAGAKRLAYCGQYMRPREFTALETRLEQAKQRSQTLQARIGDATRRLKEENRARGAEFLRVFYYVAHDLLDRETLERLVRETEERMDRDENS